MALALDLSKKLELSLVKANVTNVPTMPVGLAMDKSGSMHNEYADGLVDAFIQRFIVLGMKFDDNQSLDMAFFASTLREGPEAKPEDFDSYYRKKVPTSIKDWWGGTNYAPVIQHFDIGGQKAVEAPKKGLFSGLFGVKGNAVTAVVPNSSKKSYCCMVTDGAPSDKSRFEAAMNEASGNTFFEFVIIGTDESPAYLTEISKKYPFAHFTHFKDPARLSDQDFYDAMINDKFVQWFS